MDANNEDKINFLNHLQTNISRMSNCSFQLKGWSVAVITALLTVYATCTDNNTHNIIILIIAMFPVIAFWCLDAYYLLLETNLRTTYNIVAGIIESNTDIKCYEINPKLSKHEQADFFKVMFSKTEWPFYILLMVVVIVFGILI